jgi:hypothetical protein
MSDVTVFTQNETLTERVAEAANLIAASWRKSTESIIETATLLRMADDQLPPAEYSMLRDHLIKNVGMSASVISKLKGIARNPVMLDPNYANRLPPSYATLYQLSKLEEPILEEGIKSGEITSVTQLKDVHAKYGSLISKSRKKPEAKTTLSVTFTGDLVELDEELVARLKGILQEIESLITVNVKGL